MAGQDDDHILQLINQNEERNRQVFSSNNNNNQYTTNHNASSFSVAGRISTLVDFEFRPSPVTQLQSSQVNISHQTSGMFNPTAFNNHTNHHQHLKAASQAQTIMQNSNSSNPNAAIYHHHHHNQMLNMGHHTNQTNASGYPNIMNPTNHQLLSGQFSIPNSMASQASSRLASAGSVQSSQLSVSSNLSVPNAETAPFIVHGQSANYRPASSETTKKSPPKNGGDSPRRTFACPTCGKGFTEKFNMKRHMQIHSQSRPKYICNECSKSFAWKDNFIRHKKAAHGTNSIQYQV